jgi:hypothetical protein
MVNRRAPEACTRAAKPIPEVSSSDSWRGVRHRIAQNFLFEFQSSGHASGPVRATQA